MKRDRPYFLWDLDVNDAELRARLEASDADTRAQWQARVMREARYDDVWSYLTVERIVRDWDHISLHLGRRRPFWEYLLRKWRDDGPGLDLAEGARSLQDAAATCGASLKAMQTHPDFRRLIASRGEETCIVDLVIDRAPMIDPAKQAFGAVRVDTLREIAANKICTLLGRAEIKDLVDLEQILGHGQGLEQALADAARKDAGVDPATLAWLLDQVSIGPEAALPGGVDPRRIVAFRDDLTRRLRALAFASAKKD